MRESDILSRMGGDPVYFWKIERARQHVERLRGFAPPEGSRDPFITEYDRETGRIEVRLAPLDAFSILVGDAVQNYRSALNYIVYELARLGGVTDPKALERVEFPVFWERPPNQREIADKLGGVDPTAQAFILGLQPHIRGADYVADPIFRLHELARIDRHRALLPASYNSAFRGLGLGGNLRIDSLTIYNRITRPGALVARGVVWPIPGKPMDMKLQMTANVVFADGPCEGMNGVMTLTEIDAYLTATVIPALDPFLARR